MCVFFQKGRGIPALAPLTPYLRHLSVLLPAVFRRLVPFRRFCPAPVGIPQAITLPIQSPSSTPVISSRVLYDAQHTHNNARDEDSYSDKGNLCDYVDRAYN